jgi:hypothetical protein
MMTSLANHELVEIIEMESSVDLNSAKTCSNLNVNNNNNNGINRNKIISRLRNEIMSIGIQRGRGGDSKNIDDESLSRSEVNLDMTSQTQFCEHVRETLTYSYLFLFIFASPIALVALYFGLKASYTLTEDNQKQTAKLLRKAHLANLSALILGSFIYITCIVIFSLLFLQNDPKCK